MVQSRQTAVASLRLAATYVIKGPQINTMAEENENNSAIRQHISSWDIITPCWTLHQLKGSSKSQHDAQQQAWTNYGPVNKAHQNSPSICCCPGPSATLYQPLWPSQSKTLPTATQPRPPHKLVTGTLVALTEQPPDGTHKRPWLCLRVPSGVTTLPSRAGCPYTRPPSPDCLSCPTRREARGA